MVANATRSAPRPEICPRCSGKLAWLPCSHCHQTGRWEVLEAGSAGQPWQTGRLHNEAAHYLQRASMACPFCDGRGWIKELHLGCYLDASRLLLIFLVLLLLVLAIARYV